jgi:hypothetical protein
VRREWKPKKQIVATANADTPELTDNKFMKQKNQNTDTENTDLLSDDEALRIQGITDGPKLVAGRELRPITALTISWLQRNKFFDPDKDNIWKAAAFMFLHSEPFTKIRSVVNDRSAFLDAVDIWIEKNMPDQRTVSAMATDMNQAFSLYMAATSHSEGTESGN